MLTPSFPSFIFEALPFDAKALKIFEYQSKKCSIYKNYIEALGIQPKNVTQVNEIPFLPIHFFKTHSVSTKNDFECIFKSSGTTSQSTSQHLIYDLELYKTSFTKGFEKVYGSVNDWTILALLPSYLEQGHSSLVYMVDAFIKESSSSISAFYLNNYSELKEQLEFCKLHQKKTLLIGVSYALLDFVELYSIDFPELIVMETGGMKGRRKELIRSELHEQLQQGFGVSAIHSEYGMTELLSQAYSQKEGIFYPSSTLKAFTRPIYNPLDIQDVNQSGVLNLIDLANYYSCSFIATEDLGVVYEDGSFEVLGRVDYSDTRGCNLMVSQLF